MAGEINLGDAVLHFLGDWTQLEQTANTVATQVPAKLGAAEAAIQSTGAATDQMSKSFVVGQQGAVELGNVVNLAGETSRESMYQARGEAGLLGEAFGIHLPRHVRSFIAELPGVGTALSAAFQATAVLFIIEAIAKGVEKIIEWREEAHKLELAQEDFGTAVANSFNSLDEKLLRAGIRADELSGDHLAALNKEIELINKQSLGELQHQFDILAKAADALFKQLETHWFTFNLGSKGAEAAITDFKSKYDLLLATGQDKEASDLLAGTKKSAETVLSLMQEFKGLSALPTDNWEETNKKSAEEVRILRELNALGVGINETKARTLGIDEKTLKAQETQVTVLSAMVNQQKEIAELAAKETSTKKTETADKIESEQERILTQKIAAEKKDDAREEQRAQKAYDDYIANLDAKEKAEIAATKNGSEERIKVIDAAIKEEEAHGFQDTAYYKSLQVERVKAVQARVDQEQKVLLDADKKELSNAEQQAKREVEAAKESSTEQEKAIQDLGKARVLSQTQTSQRLVVAYEQEKTKVLAVLNSLLQEEQALMQKAANQLAQAKLNPAITPEQIAQAETLLAQLKNAVANTETQIEKVKSDANSKMLALDKGFYNQVLTLAVAAGDKKIAEQLRENHAQLLSAQAQLADAKARGADTKALQDQITQLQRHEAALLKDAANLLHVKNAGDQVLKSKPNWDSFFVDLTNGALHTGEAIKEMGQMTAEGIGSAVAAAVSGSSSFGAAMEKMAKDAIAALAEHAVVKALEEVAYGFSDLANPFMAWHAPIHFLAAAKWGAIGGIAAAVGSAIPGGGGSKSAASSSSASTGTVSAASTAGAQPTQTVNVPRLDGGGLVTRDTLAVVHGGEGVIPLNNRNAMRQLGAEIAAQIHMASGGGSNQIAIQIHSDIPGFAKVLNRHVQRGSVRIIASDSIRHTPRS